MTPYELAKEGMEVHESMPNSPEYQICKAFIEQAKRIEGLEIQVEALQKIVKELEEYKWMYEELCK